MQIRKRMAVNRLSSFTIYAMGYNVYICKNVFIFNKKHFNTIDRYIVFDI